MHVDVELHALGGALGTEGVELLGGLLPRLGVGTVDVGDEADAGVGQAEGHGGLEGRVVHAGVLADRVHAEVVEHRPGLVSGGAPQAGELHSAVADLGEGGQDRAEAQAADLVVDGVGLHADAAGRQVGADVVGEVRVRIGLDALGRVDLVGPGTTAAEGNRGRSAGAGAEHPSSAEGGDGAACVHGVVRSAR